VTETRLHPRNPMTNMYCHDLERLAAYIGRDPAFVWRKTPAGSASSGSGIGSSSGGHASGKCGHASR
jgi:hypothetical protein